MRANPWVPVVIGLAACTGSAPDLGPMSKQATADEEVGGAYYEPEAAAPAMAPPPGLAMEADDVLGDMDGSGEGAGGRSGYAGKPQARRQREEKKSKDANESDKGGRDDDQGGQGEGEARTRAWFPESFLWQPLVVTDDSGTATVDLTVPDQLTTWRVLGLAHDRSGHQAGAVHTFDSRLPLFVDPVVPGWLYVGDQLDLPIQVVNTTDASVSAQLSAEASGAMSGGGTLSLPIGPADSDVASVRVVASASGTGKIAASLSASAGNDRAEREIPVLPEGRPVKRTRGGTLAGKRDFGMGAPKDADPATQELTVHVFPGPLAVFQAEVERLQGGARPDDGAYGFALASQMGALAGRTGVDLEPRVARSLQMVAWQRIVRASRAPDAGVASDLLASMQGVTGHELAEALRPRLVRTVVDGQRGDGTWSRTGSGTLQQVLVQTAWAARALPETEEGARLRAGGALERYAPQVDDPYTAAVLAASGIADADLKQRLQGMILEAVTTGSDGERGIAVPSDVVNPWGYRPSHPEMLAWCALALSDRTDLDWRYDLVAQLMGGYSGRWGFGAGPADAIALEAIAAGLPGLSQPVDVVLSIDGKDVARAKVDPAQPRVPAVLLAATGGRAGSIGLRAEPQVAGLAFVATLDSWVPWSGDESLPGVEVEAKLSPLVAGAPGTLSLTLSAPSGEALTVEQGLPAGTTVDEAGLAALAGPLVRWEVGTDTLRLVTRPFQAGEVMSLTIPVQPAFSGRFATPPLNLQSRSGREVALPPLAWNVARPPGS